MSNEPSIRDMAEAVHGVFVRMGFTWLSCGTPTASRIADEISRLISVLLYDETLNFVRCGRIRVERDRDCECFDVSVDLGSFGLDVEQLMRKESK